MAAEDLILFDGVCGLCNRAVRFLLKRDVSDRLRFAALQSRVGQDALSRHGIRAAELDTLYVLQSWQSPEERVRDRAQAVLYLLTVLGGGWRVLARILSVLPQLFLQAGYHLIARFRYRLFGKYDACPLPSSEERQKFIDI